ncbi:MAG: hypothetical protein BGO25_03520 [Acidobacteriales bacterium 59-55]|nr:MAG: hypothetical protein BGO25_03520 [Acidobacteriales bacterium 59-55]
MAKKYIWWIERRPDLTLEMLHDFVHVADILLPETILSARKLYPQNLDLRWQAINPWPENRRARSCKGKTD